MRLPMPAPRAHEVLASIDAERLERLVLAVARPDDGGQYRHWETFRRVRPPDGFSVAEWWFAVRQARRAIAVALPLTTGSRQPFTVSMPPAAHEMARLVERRASGQIVTPAVVTDPRTRDRYIVSALIEEAITSSQLEGASTTRRVAKQMLRSGRPPRTHAERMILGNHRAMEYVRRQGDRALTPPAVLDLHRVIGEGSIEDGELGRLQTAADERVAVYWDDGVLLHQPPPADQLPDRLERLCAFANGRPVDGYLHPVVRAILVHFWLAHDHPFADGNGRTARALFYWTMLREGYWLTEFISISRILRAAPARYAQSFLYVETDAGDTTYFVLAQLDVLLRAIAELDRYLERKVAEIRTLERRMAAELALNHRQRALLSSAVRDGDARYTYRSHARSHQVTFESARRDLQGLEALGFLERRKVGRQHTFQPAPDLSARLSSIRS